MKITESIDLSGFIFTIDDDAYMRLQSYLSSIEHSLEANEEQKEIVADIESRIAELFQAQLNKAKEVITLDDIEEVILILGRPEDFLQGEATQERKTSHNAGKKTNKLYRDNDNRIIGGVCSGLGEYFNIDPVIVRVLFVILTLIAMGGIFVYIAFWIVIPPAISLDEKLQMKGYKV